MMRGYRCKHKKAAEILQSLGFDPNVNRGWVLLRRGSKTSLIKSGKPCQIHAMINIDFDGTQYIDVHSDFIVDGKHVSERGRRTMRFNQLFKQIDDNKPCNAGLKLKKHYKGLEVAVNKYHERF